MSYRILFALATVLALVGVFSPVRPQEPVPPSATVYEKLDGLVATVRVVRDSDGVPHIFAENDHDAAFMVGYLHAQDRLFSMDRFRRFFSGTLAELVGESALEGDIQMRTLGLRRSGEASWEASSPVLKDLIQAYSDGINTSLDDPSRPLPPEYAVLELTDIPPWTPIDTLTLAQGLVFGRSFTSDIPLTLALEAHEAAGEELGFDGTALFYQDVFRVAPFDTTLSIPRASTDADESSSQSGSRVFPGSNLRLHDAIKPETLELARRYREAVRRVPWLDRLFSGDRSGTGSNWWVIGGDHTESGNVMLANDPHLSLGIGSGFYETHFVVSDDPNFGPMNVTGVSFAGAPFIVQGCNERICWGSTTNPLDVTDTFEEELVVDLIQQIPTHTLFEAEREPLVVIPQTYRVNQVGNGTPDDLETANVGNLSGGLTFLVPRRNMGPIVSVDLSQFPKVTALSVQYSGFSATREGEAFFRWSRARNLEDFKEALPYLDVTSQNLAYADVEGNIAYFTDSEIPLREDLQSGQVDGLPPFFIRSGNHQFQNEWLPLENPQLHQVLNFELLPLEEMPQLINPGQGYLLNANNDPVGTTLDNDLFNQTRKGGGIYYLNLGYASLRAGRTRRLIEQQLADGGKFSLDDMIRLQSDNQLLDAEVFTPPLLRAFANAQDEAAPPLLAALAADAGVSEAMGRFASWNFTTPTGIQEGYDPGDEPDKLPEPSPEEIGNSVAATIYSVWRGQIVQNVLDATLERLGLGEFHPDSERSLSALRNLLDHFPTNQGVGASGVNFFQVEGIDSPENARDFLILKSLDDALDLLASDSFATAYGRSTDQEDYRWGRLHRIVIDHPLGDPFNIPEAGGFSHLSPELPGLARSGGYETVDTAAHDVRAVTPTDFMYIVAPARRFVAELSPSGIKAFQIISGGQSGVPDTPFFSNQLARWLTNQYHPMRIAPADVASDELSVEVFTPRVFRYFFPFYQGDSRSFTGIAISSLIESLMNLEFLAFNMSGSETPFPDNPRRTELEEGRQLALLGHELFGVPASSEQAGWIELQATPVGAVNTLGPILGTFTQFGSFDLSRLDGSVGFTDQSRRLILTRVFQGSNAFRGRSATTLLSVANPNATPVTVELACIPTGQGQSALSGVSSQSEVLLRRTLEIPGKGFVFGSLPEILEQDLSVSGGYVELGVREGQGVVAFELVRLDDQDTVLGLNASFASSGPELFSAQLASGPEVFTNVKFVNTSDEDRELTISPIAEDGTTLADAATVNLGPGQSFEQDVAELFGFGDADGALALPGIGSPMAGGTTQGTTVVGSMRVEVSGGGVVGDVIFGDPVELGYAAALPLQTTPFTEAVFSQVANMLGFFTGMAFFNTGMQTAEIRIQIFSADGVQSGDVTVLLGPGKRISKLVSEFDPATAGQARGFIRIISSQPLIAQQLFGTSDLSLLSATPPTIVQTRGALVSAM